MKLRALEDGAGQRASPRLSTRACIARQGEKVTRATPQPSRRGIVTPSITNGEAAACSGLEAVSLLIQ
jgi:hypothetical protein